MKANILITGKPGIGKTTVVEKVASRLKDKAGGFFSREIRSKGRRTGFSLITLDGRKGILAHRDSTSPRRVGRYGVETDDLERIALPAVIDALRSGRVVVIDEIARMELYSEAFKSTVIEALDSPAPVLAVLQAGRDPFLARIRKRSDILLVSVTRENRDLLPDEIIPCLLK